MNNAELIVHLKKLHEKILVEMKEVVNLDCPPLEIIVRPLLVTGGIWSVKVDGRDVDQIVINDILSEKNIVEAEYTIAHETGHYFHLTNPKVREDAKLWRELLRGTRKCERMLNYAELTADFFAINYLDRTEGIDSFFNDRGREVKCDLRSQPYLFYSSLSVQERGQVCNWLINHSYEEAKKEIHKNPFKSSLRFIINNG